VASQFHSLFHSQYGYLHECSKIPDNLYYLKLFFLTFMSFVHLTDRHKSYWYFEGSINRRAYHLYIYVIII